MSEIQEVALVCPAKCDARTGRFTTTGLSQVKAAAAELNRGDRFTDPVVLHPLGQRAYTVTANFLGAKLADGEYTILESPLINALNNSPRAWVGKLRGLLETAMIGNPPIRPPLEHCGNIVAVVSPEAIAALTGLTQVAGIIPGTAYYPELI